MVDAPRFRIPLDSPEWSRRWAESAFGRARTRDVFDRFKDNDAERQRLDGLVQFQIERGALAPDKALYFDAP